jgi:hypothetical protein
MTPLEKSIRILELKTAINHLKGRLFPSDEEIELLKVKTQALEEINPVGPPEPSNITDLGGVTVADLDADIEQGERRCAAKSILKLLADPTTPKERRARLLFDPDYIFLEHAQDRRKRFDMMQTRKAWESDQAEKARRESNG